MLRLMTSYKFIIILGCFYSLLLAGFNSTPCIEIDIVPTTNDFVKIGDDITFVGRITSNKVHDAIPSEVGVEDPISRLTTKIFVSPDSTFIYTSQSPASFPGIYAFVFFYPSSDKIYKEIYIISVQPERISPSNCHIISLDELDPSLGNQNDSLDDETNLVCQKVKQTIITDESGLDRATLSYFAESFSESISDYWQEYIKDLSTSPTTFMVLSGAAITCVASSGSLCIPAGLVVLQELVATSVETDIEMLVNNSDLDPLTKEKILQAGKLGLSGIFSVVGVNSLGGIYNLSNFSSKIAEFTWEYRPRIYNVKFDSIGDISGYSIEAFTDDGDLINYRADFWKEKPAYNSALHTFKFWDTNIVLNNGRQLLGNIISGEFGGIKYGLLPPVYTNFLSFIDNDGVRIDIPKNEILSVERKRIKITNIISDNLVTLNIGEGYGLYKGLILNVYRESENILLHTIEKQIIGTIQLFEIGEQTSQALIVNQYNRATIKYGDICL